MTHELLVRAHKSGNRRRWIVNREAGRIFGSYARGENSTAALAAELAVSHDTIRNWALAGQLREACRGLTYLDETGRVWSFYDLRQNLSVNHFQVAGKALNSEAASPQELVDWLGIAAVDRKSAEWLGAQVMPGATSEKQPTGNAMADAYNRIMAVHNEGWIKVTPCSLEVLPKMENHKNWGPGPWAAIMADLLVLFGDGHTTDNVNWWVGDFSNYGDKTWGQKESAKAHNIAAWLAKQPRYTEAA